MLRLAQLVLGVLVASVVAGVVSCSNDDDEPLVVSVHSRPSHPAWRVGDDEWLSQKALSAVTATVNRRNATITMTYQLHTGWPTPWHYHVRMLDDSGTELESLETQCVTLNRGVADESNLAFVRDGRSSPPRQIDFAKEGAGKFTLSVSNRAATSARSVEFGVTIMRGDFFDGDCSPRS